MWLTKLERLADPKYGLTVRFENGWKRRGASGGAQMKGVHGVLWHHDVAPRSGTYPLRNMLRNGRPGLSGPLCHIGFDRDGTVWVVGAGKANHAGTGSVPGVVRNGGNTRLIGIEMTSAGTRPWDWTAAQLRQMPRLGAALNDIFGLTASKHWAHYEYSNGGKIDPAGLPGAMPGLRSRIGAVRFSGVPGGGTSVPATKPKPDPKRPWLTSPRVKGMSKAEVREIQHVLAGFDLDLGSYGVDGSYGDATGTAVQTLQRELHITPTDGIYGPGTEQAVMTIREDINKLTRTLEPGIKGKRTDGEFASFIRDQRNILRGDIAQSRAAIIKAVQETGKAQGLSDAQVAKIAQAAAEAAASVSAEDVAGLLDVTVKG